ncbi:MAG: hypothetical protein GY694_09530 [Gammaproteobacteria bacterium]|nr:hypothetical protein [Gammaproteobacteria bacterium]
MHKLIEYLFPGVIRKILMMIGYVSLLGPSQAIAIKKRADKNIMELSGTYYFYILLYETALRLSLFLISVFLVEYFMDDDYFSLFRIDLFFFLLLGAGLMHQVFYYIGVILLKNHFGMKLYRLGRNLSYAVVPAILSAIGVLIIQSYNQIEPFSGSLVVDVSGLVYVLFSLVGIIEALVQKGTAISLGIIDIPSAFNE